MLSFKQISNVLKSGLNLYIICEKIEDIKEILNENNIPLIEKIEDVENLVSDEIFFLINTKLNEKIKTKNQRIVLISNKYDVLNEEYYVLKQDFSNMYNEINFVNKEEFFSYIALFDLNDVIKFFSQNQKKFENKHLIESYLYQKVDIKLIKIKMVELWKY